MRHVNNGSFEYTALQLHPSVAREDSSLCWSFESKDGYDIQLVQRHDGEYRWQVSWSVDGVNIQLDIHQACVIACGVGPARVDGNCKRAESGAGAA